MTTAMLIRRTSSTPLISVIMPVFNQEDNVVQALSSVVESLAGTFEIVVVDDNSEDSTFFKLQEWTQSPIFTSKDFDFTVIRNERSLFETASDNIGFDSARGDFLLEVQADMVLRDPGFDMRMISAFIEFPDLALLSGRGVTKIDSVAIEFQHLKTKHILRFGFDLLSSEAVKVYSRLKRRYVAKKMADEGQVFPVVNDPNQGYGRLGMSICTDINGVFNGDEVFFGPYVMRGPLMVSRSALQALGYLDSASFYLGFDDAEWCLKAKQMGLRAAFHPVVFDSELANGATRKTRSFRQLFRILQLEVRSRKTSFHTLLFNYKGGDRWGDCFTSGKLPPKA